MFVQKKKVVSIAIDLSSKVGLYIHVTVHLKMTSSIQVTDKVHITLSSQFWHRVMLVISIIFSLCTETRFRQFNQASGLIKYGKITVFVAAFRS